MPNTPKNNKNNKKKSPQANIRNVLAFIVVFTLVMFFVNMMLARSVGNTATSTDTLATSEFVQAVDQGRVSKVTYDVSSDTVTGTYYPAATAGSSIADAFNTTFTSLNSLVGLSDQKLAGVTTQTVNKTDLGSETNFTSTYVGEDSLDTLMAAHPEITYQVQLPNQLLNSLISLLPFLLFGGLLVYFFVQMNRSGNSQMSFGKAKAKKYNEERPKVTFDDVAGCEEAVEEMREVKDFLANPRKYQELGAKIPRGCLLVGPPGTGKTLLARAVAGEAGVPFFSISGSDFVEMFVGVGASRVRDLFQQAKDAAPAIIFIDEIDAVGRQRGAGLGGGHDEREQTLNQLLVEMDGFESNEAVVLIAATNRSDVLDPALLRPGRFDRQIVVDAPDIRGREKILRVHAKGKPISKDVDLDKIAKLTPGFTGADLSNLLNESALLTARRNKHVIDMDAVQASMERVIAGPERKGRVMSEETRTTIAYHESGHALVGHTLPGGDPVHKISIISRGRALGYTMSIPDEDQVLAGYNQMRDQLAGLLGGRVAEEIYRPDITTGASNDLERATKIARSMVTQYGMSPELGHQIFGQPNHEVFLGRDYGNTQDYSEETARRIDNEVSRLMAEAHDRAYEILSTHKEQMDLMASVLLDRETVDGEACQALLNNRWDEYVAYEQSEEGRHAREEAATTVADPATAPKIADNAPQAGVQPPAGAAPVAQARDGGVVDALVTPVRPVGSQAPGAAQPTTPMQQPGAGVQSVQPSQQQPVNLNGQVAQPVQQPAQPAAPQTPAAPQAPQAPAANSQPQTPNEGDQENK